MKKFIIIGLILLTSGSYAQKENRYLREGNRSFRNGNYTDAEKDYRKALEVNRESTIGQFNLGTAVYQEKNYEESANIFAGLGERILAKTDKAEVLHNLGNSLLEGKQYEKSIEAYKQALMNNPNDLDSKYNLEYARMKLRQEQQQNQQNKDNQDKKDQDKKDQDKKDQDQQDQQQNQDKQDQQKQPPRPDKISKEDAERMLEAMKNDEKKTMEKVKKQKVKAVVVGIEKDW